MANQASFLTDFSACKGKNMANTRFTHATLAAISSVVAEHKISIEDELEYFSEDPAQAQRFAAVSGLHTRRRADDNVTASDMCAQAAKNLLQHTNANTNDIGAILFVSHSADYLLPASAAILQHKLGLPRTCVAMDMNAGCAGFVNGLWMAASLVESGACKKVLLLAGDTPGRFQPAANRVIGPIFGDAGTAALIEHSETPTTMSFSFGTDGSKHEALIIPGGGSRIPYVDSEGADSPFNQTIPDGKGNPWTLGRYCSIWMDPMGIYTFSTAVVPPHIKEHLAFDELEAESINRLFLHQANKIIVDSIAKRVGINKDRVPDESLRLYGNMGVSSIPVLICAHYAKENSELSATGHKNSMLCSFGAGLSWASAILSLDKTIVLPVCDYIKEKTESRAKRIEYWHSKFSGPKTNEDAP